MRALELSTLQTHIIVYMLGCRIKISIRTFFRFGFEAARSILSRFFDLNGFTLFMDHDAMYNDLGQSAIEAYRTILGPP